MRIRLSSVLVNDQAKALKFYTEVLDFVKKRDIPMGDARWLTLVSPEEPEGTEFVLEPDANPSLHGAAKKLKEALYGQGIAWTAFAVEGIQSEYERLKRLGVAFTLEPTPMGEATIAVLDDTYGNLIQIYQV